MHWLTEVETVNIRQADICNVVFGILLWRLSDKKELRIERIRSTKKRKEKKNTPKFGSLRAKAWNAFLSSPFSMGTFSLDVSIYFSVCSPDILS